MGGRQIGGDGKGAAVADGVAEAAGAHGMQVRVGGNIKDDIVVAGGADAAGDIVEVQAMADFPGDDVVGAGSVAANTEGADDFAGGIVEGEAAAKDVHAADFAADHRIVVLAVVLGGSFIGDGRVHGIALLQAEETAAGLDGRIRLAVESARFARLKALAVFAFCAEMTRLPGH